MQVGPLPLSAGSFIEPLYPDGQIPFVKRPPNDLPEAVALVSSLLLTTTCRWCTSFAQGN